MTALAQCQPTRESLNLGVDKVNSGCSAEQCVEDDSSYSYVLSKTDELKL